MTEARSDLNSQPCSPPQRPLKSVNFLMSEEEFKIVKVYATCKSITIRDLVGGIIRDWMKENRETIEKLVGKVSNGLS